MADDSAVAADLIEHLRREIDEIDESIIKMVKLRTERAAQIARLKRTSNIPMVSGNRERDVFSRYAKALGDLGKTMVSALIVKHRAPETDSGPEPEAEKR